MELVKMTTEKGTMLREEDTIAKLPENYKSVKIGRLKVLDSYRFIDSSLDKLYTTLKPFSSLDANGMEDDLLKRKLAYSDDKVTKLNRSTNNQV